MTKTFGTLLVLSFTGGKNDVSSFLSVSKVSDRRSSDYVITGPFGDGKFFDPSGFNSSFKIYTRVLHL